jgi:hypothetical protein
LVTIEPASPSQRQILEFLGQVSAAEATPGKGTRLAEAVALLVQADGVQGPI